MRQLVRPAGSGRLAPQPAASADHQRRPPAAAVLVVSPRDVPVRSSLLSGQPQRLPAAAIGVGDVERLGADGEDPEPPVDDSPFSAVHHEPAGVAQDRDARCRGGAFDQADELAAGSAAAAADRAARTPAGRPDAGPRRAAGAAATSRAAKTKGLRVGPTGAAAGAPSASSWTSAGGGRRRGRRRRGAPPRPPGRRAPACPGTARRRSTPSSDQHAEQGPALPLSGHPYRPCSRSRRSTSGRAATTARRLRPAPSNRRPRNRRRSRARRGTRGCRRSGPTARR